MLEVALKYAIKKAILEKKIVLVACPSFHWEIEIGGRVLCLYLTRGI